MAAKGREDDILAAMEAISMAGDAYIPYDELLLKCTQCAGGISGAQFHEDIAMLLQDGVLHREGERIYLPNIWQAEASAADNLFEMLLHNKIRAVMALPHRPCASLLLDPMQQEAVAMALTHRISIVSLQ